MAFASGLALYGVTVILVGFLSAVAIPSDFFTHFGRQNSGLALLLLNAVTIAAPLALISYGWFSITLRFVSLTVVSAAVLCIAGYLIGLGYSYLDATMNFLSLEADGKVPLSVFVRSALPWWNVPVLLAVPLGIVGAATLRSRALRPAR
jgi:hypothetical protein